MPPNWNCWTPQCRPGCRCSACAGGCNWSTWRAAGPCASTWPTAPGIPRFLGRSARTRCGSCRAPGWPGSSAVTETGLTCRPRTTRPSTDSARAWSPPPGRRTGSSRRWSRAREVIRSCSRCNGTRRRGRTRASSRLWSPPQRPGCPSTLASVSDTPAVEIRDLVKRYGHTAAVDGLSLRAGRGAVTAVLGPNGAGKTTTIEICEGYRRPDAGTVAVLGLDPVAEARALRPRVGVMLQSGGIPPAVRPGEYLGVLARFYAHPLDPAWLLDRLGLSGAARTQVRRLSGGQQQRVSLAAAVIGRPELVFLDEPTSGLDPQARRATWDLIAGLRAAGASVILTTHHMDEAERLADHVAIVDHGKLVAGGTPAELTGTAGQLRFRAEPGLDTDGLLAALAPGAAAKESPAGHYLVEVRDRVDPQLVASVTAWCAEHGVLAQDLRIESRTLEDVFLELTGRELRS